MITINTHPKNLLERDFTPVPSGFLMKFDNGNTISVQWGTGLYCSNREGDSKDSCLSAEIQIMNKEGEELNYPGGSNGWKGSDSVALWIHFASSTIYKGEVDWDKMPRIFSED